MDLEEQDFATKAIYQSRMENITNTTLHQLTIIHTKMKTTTIVNVLQTSESKVMQNQQYIFLPREQIWSRYDQGEDKKPKPTPNHCSFYRQEGHAFTKYPSLTKMYRIYNDQSLPN